MSSTFPRNSTRVYTPFQQAARNRPPLLLFRHAGRILQSRAATVRARVPPGRNSFEKVRFTASDIPPLSFWTERAKPPIVQSDEVSAAECLEACQRYTALALEDSPNWRQQALAVSSSSSTSKHNDKIPLYTLHYAAIMMLPTPFAGHLTTHMLYTGVLLGYAPSVLTMVRLGLKRDLLDRPHFALVTETLEKLVKTETDPSFSAAMPNAKKPNSRGSGNNSYYLADALTAIGLVHARAGTPADDDRALKSFVLAEVAANSSSSTPAAFGARGGGVWQWRASAVQEHINIVLKRNQPDRAREVLRTAARELDNAELLYQYARLLAEDDPERVELLERAAVCGIADAAREMSRVELGRLEEEEKKKGGKGLSDREKRDKQFLADEWLGIARDKAII